MLYITYIKKYNDYSLSISQSFLLINKIPKHDITRLLSIILLVDISDISNFVILLFFSQTIL